jgi:hypothetical protein
MCCYAEAAHATIDTIARPAVTDWRKFAIPARTMAARCRKLADDELRP